MNEIRIINLYDEYTNFLVVTNVPEQEIKNAIEYKNEMLKTDDPSCRSDFEEMKEYLHNKGYFF